jgi:hypothetical protein
MFPVCERGTLREGALDPNIPLEDLRGLPLSVSLRCWLDALNIAVVFCRLVAFLDTTAAMNGEGLLVLKSCLAIVSNIVSGYQNMNAIERSGE